MTRKLLRLELLKLVWRPLPQGAVEQALVDAKKLEEFCLEHVEEAPKSEKLTESAAFKPQQPSVKKGNGR